MVSDKQSQNSVDKSQKTYPDKKIWDILIKISLLLTVLSSGITIAVFFEIKNIQDVLQTSNSDKFDIQLFEPKKKFPVTFVTIDGKIKYKNSVKSVNSKLMKMDFDVFAIVQFNHTTKWRIYRIPFIEANGNISLDVHPSSSKRDDLLKAVVIICKKDKLCEGIDLPYLLPQVYESISNQVKIKLY